MDNFLPNKVFQTNITQISITGLRKFKDLCILDYKTAVKVCLCYPPVCPANIPGLINVLIAFQSTLPHHANQKLCLRVVVFCGIVGFPVLPSPSPLLLLFFSFPHWNVFTITWVKMYATHLLNMRSLCAIV